MPKKKAKNKPKELTKKTILFIHYYVIHRNGTKAATEAGFSARSAHSTSTRLLNNPKVREEINKRLEKLQDKLELSAERVLLEMKRLAFYDPADLYDENGVLIPIKDLPEDTRRAIKGWDVEQNESQDINKAGDVTKIETRTSIKPRLADKRPVLRDLGQHLDLFDDENPDSKRPINVNINY